jgi:ATP-dependent Lhr-like helicase
VLALEAEGSVLRGRFSSRACAIPPRGGSHGGCDGGSHEWCDRALLARIHRYTVNRLRAEIEPVSPADFMRFLFKWQHVDPSDRLTGLDGLREALALLDGFETAAAAWERTVLPARVEGYEPAMLDMLCLAGEAAWGRLSPPAAGPDPPRLAPSTPIALFLREHAGAWRALAGDRDVPEACGLAPRRVLAALQSRGAFFFSELRTAAGLDDTDARTAIGTLVAAGLAASDGFSGLRALIAPASTPAGVVNRRATFAGRWTAASTEPSRDRESALEAQAWALLHRYGVVFRRLASREPAAPWRDLVRVYRRLEARGEIRGGRFVAGMPGEQFAVARAVERLREVRRTPADGRILAISAADPLNLAGIVTAGERVAARRRTRVAYRDGVPLAIREADAVRPLMPLDPAVGARVARALAPPRRGAPPVAVA